MKTRNPNSKRLFIRLLLTMLSPWLVCSATSSALPVVERRQALFPQDMKLKISTRDQVLLTTLQDNATARDFYALLPLTLKLKDNAATELIAYLPRKLSTAGAPAAYEGQSGDLAYYAPWGNLALFYKKSIWGSAKGLVWLGKLEGDLHKLVTSHREIYIEKL